MNTPIICMPKLTLYVAVPGGVHWNSGITPKSGGPQVCSGVNFYAFTGYPFADTSLGFRIYRI